MTEGVALPQLLAGKYELVRPLGRGGMGAVYEARHVHTRKRCAVKLLLRPELASDAEVSKRFFREARAGGLIESEHVVATFDSGVDEHERIYYVMEYLEGEDLSQRLKRGPLRSNTVLKLMLHATAGLSRAHALGVVHRDIKPGNLFLAEAGDETKLKILDFGVAKVKLEVFGESADSYTRGGSLLGTPQYMSPEQMKRASATSGAADVWSLGVVMYECLSGKSPWGEVESVGELLAAILTQEVPQLQDDAPWVGPELASIVHRCLARDLDYRFRDAAELRQALRLLDSEARLLAGELGALTAEERSLVAPRLLLADTVPLGESSSSVPVVVSGLQPPRRAAFGRATLAVAAATAMLTAAAIYAAGRASRNVPTPSSAVEPSVTPPAPEPQGKAPFPVASAPSSTAPLARPTPPPADVSPPPRPRPRPRPRPNLNAAAALPVAAPEEAPVVEGATELSQTFE